MAAQAGVSITTAWKVANGRSDVSLGTRRKVQAALIDQGYRPRSRNPRRTRLIEFVVHELESAWVLELVKGVQQAARANRAALVFSELEGRVTPLDSWLTDVLERHPLAVVSAFSVPPEEHRKSLAAAGVPLVAIDPVTELADRTPSVSVANWNGGLAATRHLLALGHRRIGMISGPPDILCGRARLDGYRAALDSAQVPVDPELIRHGDFLVGGGLREARALLALERPPTAVFVGNDIQALGVYEAAREAGLRIPADLSVVGFDDLPLTPWMGPALTTIRQPLSDMGAAALTMALNIANGEPPPHSEQIFPAELVVRASTAPPA
ncbi:substrate-binding domain-containing protein [Sphaerisporangium melleum]|uniref:substrate-binding domain-containing protein n=1 Tax=Sphaerisporangium melleum TaxID=321316 RepID=UPI001E3DF467|nr:substrate-binding domain-containing protein [Sphaerisporangium melleum]